MCQDLNNDLRDELVVYDTLDIYSFPVYESPFFLCALSIIKKFTDFA